MIRSALTVSTLAAALILSGCASQSPAPASSSPQYPSAAAAAPAMSDAQIAEKLKGNWSGEWSLPGFGAGKFELIVTEVSGTTVKGNANWYGTATGDVKAPLDSASVSGGTLNGKQATGTFKLSLKGDNALSGTWSAGGYSGPLNAKR